MGRIEGLRRFFRVAESNDALERDAELEVGFHLDMKVRELVDKGMSPEQARAEARRRFGDVRATRERIEQIDRERLGRERRAAWWSAVAQDLRYAIRGLGRQRAFTAVVVLTLGLGIGANATMFGIVDRLLLRPPAHVQDADRLARVFFVIPREGAPPSQNDRASVPQFATMRDRVTEFELMAAVFATDMILGDGVDTRQIRGTMTTASFFPLLGVRPALGRFFGEDEDRIPAGEPVAVISHAFWQNHFGGDLDVLGAEIRLGRVPYTVIGVAPQGFTGADLERIDVWVPIASAGSTITDDWHEQRNMTWIQVLGRLRPGVDPRQTNLQATSAWHEYIRAGGGNVERQLALGPRVEVAPLLEERGPNRTDGSRIALWLAGVAAIVLIIACANVANLLLARAMRRRREIAVRLALGVGRSRLVAQLLVESLLLAVLGGVAGLVIARWGGAIVRSALLPDIVWSEHLLDVRVVAFTAVATLVTGLLAGLAPALQASRPDIAGALKAGAREGSYQRSRVRTGLLLAQAALSVVLLVGAGLFVLSLRNVRVEPLGFNADRVLLATYDFTGAEVSSESRLDAYRRAYEHLQRVPGVRSVSLGTTGPFWARITTGISVPGVDSIPRTESGGPQLHSVSPEYFATMGTRIVRGRGFTDADNRRGAAGVSLVNETMARLLWPGEEAIGKCIKLGADTNPCNEVIGVVEDSRSSEIRSEEVMKYYLPIAQERWAGTFRALFVRTDGEPARLVGTLQREMQLAAPQATFAEVRPMLELIDPLVRPWRLGATMFTIFGGLAVVLAAIGLYSVMAYSVTQRTHEMGVRMALGAQGGDVLRLVLREGVGLATVGIAIGAGIALVATRWVAPLLYDVAPNDPRVFAVVAAGLLVVAVAANTIPAWRAARVSPITALKAE
jgi:predicted permease